MSDKKLKEKLRTIANNKGGKLFGVCRIDELRENMHPEIKNALARLNTAISIGVPLSGTVLDSIKNRPNMLYKAHYQQVNHILNDISYLITSEINENGGEAIPIPASQIMDWDQMTAHLSHREIAYKAGLGWRGRNNLLVAEKYGSKVRLVTVLTDLELEIDKPMDRDCGDCYNCLTACPADAIDEQSEDFDLQACYRQVQEFSRYKGYGHLICGLCLQCCDGDS
ncbi:MAG: epoxyqueuosine reductase [candidate division Zixibacteria bacterium]|nr:epoxyqueuosine reductase [candidate division Zixibacteria bacterium]